jgi:hypothetical protein
VTGLLPDMVREAVQAKSRLGATGSFGAVAAVLLIVLLLQREVLGSAAPGGRTHPLRAVLDPLLVLVVLILAVRLAALAA